MTLQSPSLSKASRFRLSNGVSQIGVSFGGLYNKDYVCLGSILGSQILGTTKCYTGPAASFAASRE